MRGRMARPIRCLAEPVVQAAYVWDKHVAGLRFNGGLNALLGYSNDEVGYDVKQWLEAVHPDDRWTVESQMRSLGHQRGTLTAEYRLRHKNGTFVLVEDRRYAITSHSGEIDCVFGVLTDISRRKRVAEPQESIHAIA